MKEKKILSNTELKAVLQDKLSFDEYLALYKDYLNISSIWKSTAKVNEQKNQ